ncbi:MAG: hypothetical protein PHI78_04900 [Clostridia bacterium]|nr:hypothetical protein [Clostridia bacterium]
MKSFFRVLSAVFVMTGSVIGAGFATGREIFVFFYGGNSIVVGVLCFFLFFTAFTVVSLFANRFQISATDEMFKRLYGKVSLVAETSLSLCLFFVLSTMLAAANLCLSDLTGIDEKFGVFAVVTAVLSALILKKGIKGVKALNALAVPLIIFFVAAVCAGGGGAQGNAKFFPSLGYVCFNVVMMSGILTNLAKSMTKKENIIASFISALLLGTLITLELLRLNDPVYSFVPMPLISLAKNYGYWFYLVATAVLYLSILTTILSTGFPLVVRMEKIFNDKKSDVWVLMFLATVFSFAGFDAIIAYAYPIMSVLGAVNLIFIVGYLIKDLIYDKKICFLRRKGANILDKSVK